MLHGVRRSPYDESHNAFLFKSIIEFHNALNSGSSCDINGPCERTIVSELCELELAPSELELAPCSLGWDTLPSWTACESLSEDAHTPFLRHGGSASNSGSSWAGAGRARSRALPRGWLLLLLRHLLMIARSKRLHFPVVMLCCHAPLSPQNVIS